MTDSENSEDTNEYQASGSTMLLNNLFQKILNQQGEILMSNISILMEADDILLDNDTKNEMIQSQLQMLTDNLTQEFHEIFLEKNDPKDEFNKCSICFGDEIPYLKLNCSCQLMLHRECYFEYLNQRRRLNCPVCNQTIFANYLSENH
jgi:hypothetical protein